MARSTLATRWPRSRSHCSATAASSTAASPGPVNRPDRAARVAEARSSRSQDWVIAEPRRAYRLFCRRTSFSMVRPAGNRSIAAVSRRPASAGSGAGGGGRAASARWSLHRHHASATEEPAAPAQIASAMPIPEYGVRTAVAATRPPPSTLHRRAELCSRLSRREYLVRSSTAGPSPFTLVGSASRLGGSAGRGGVAPLLVHAGADLVEPGHARRVGGGGRLDGGLGRGTAQLLPRHARPGLLEAGRARPGGGGFLPPRAAGPRPGWGRPPP